MCGTEAAAVAASLEQELEGGGSAEAPAPEGAASSGNTSAATAAAVPCRSNQLAALNVSSDTAYLSLHPGLRYPNIQVQSSWVLVNSHAGVMGATGTLAFNLDLRSDLRFLCRSSRRCWFGLQSFVSDKRLLWVGTHWVEEVGVSG